MHHSEHLKREEKEIGSESGIQGTLKLLVMFKVNGSCG